MSDDKIYPLKFEPVFRDYIWGGRNLEKLFGRELPPGKVAESWEISAHAVSSTKVEFGALQGKTLPEVMTLLGEDLVGSHYEEAVERDLFPLLIKLLDANRDLSVQVHPADDYAQAHENGEQGKTEMWYVLWTKPDARLIYGLKRGTTKESFRRALNEKNLESCLHYLSIKPGDVIFVPPGTIHALLAGAVVAEIQQNSNVTYRVYDWNRVDDDGNSRPLHVDKALDVINFDMEEPSAARRKLLETNSELERVELARSPHFIVEEIKLARDARYRDICDGSSLEIWGCIEGRCAVEWNGAPVNFERVRFVLLPAALGDFTISAKQDSRLLRVYL